MARITVEDCLNKVPNRFELVLVGARRAKQLLKGARPLVESDNKEVVTALREIAAGEVGLEYVSEEEPAGETRGADQGRRASDVMPRLTDRDGREGSVRHARRGAHASSDEIKKAYRKLARKHHPDVNPGNAEAEEKFKAISEAHDILADPEKRKLYDEFGMTGVQSGFDAGRAREARTWQSAAGARSAGQGARGYSSFEDVFGDIFGPGGGGFRAAPSAGPISSPSWRSGCLTPCAGCRRRSASSAPSPVRPAPAAGSTRRA